MALASGTPPTAIAIVRLSGPGVIAKIRPLLIPRHATSDFDRMMRLYSMVDPATGTTIDELAAVVYRAPRSYTGEDSAELFCHGGPFVVRRILEVLGQTGFVLAGPGEFTKRAFLNGKHDLTAAEGINELIAAQSQEQWLAARQLATGQLRRAIDHLRNKLIGARALLAARIDFPEEGDTQDVTLGHVGALVGEASTEIEALLGTYEAGRVAAQGLMVVLVGAPNAGKSTLLNTLLGKDRALVSEVAGTTRDYIEERCLIEGHLVRLVDTAGIRSTHDPVESMGVERSLSLMQKADVVIWLVAGGVPEKADEFFNGTDIAPTKVIRLATKADLIPTAPGWLAASAMTGQGLSELRHTIADACSRCTGALDRESTFITTERHYQALKAASVALDRYRAAADSGEYEECLDFELQSTVQALGSIIGAVDVEDVLDRVFSEFCVGK